MKAKTATIALFLALAAPALAQQTGKLPQIGQSSGSFPVFGQSAEREAFFQKQVEAREAREAEIRRQEAELARARLEAKAAADRLAAERAANRNREDASDYILRGCYQVPATVVRPLPAPAPSADSPFVTAPPESTVVSGFRWVCPGTRPLYPVPRTNIDVRVENGNVSVGAKIVRPGLRIDVQTD